MRHVIVRGSASSVAQISAVVVSASVLVKASTVIETSSSYRRERGNILKAISTLLVRVDWSGLVAGCHPAPGPLKFKRKKFPFETPLQYAADTKRANKFLKR
jgi:hypothetical protein